MKIAVARNPTKPAKWLEELPQIVDESDRVFIEATKVTAAIKAAANKVVKEAQHSEEDTDDHGGRVEIVVAPGFHEQATAEAEEVLVRHARELGIFQRDEIVKVITLPELTESGGLKRQAGTVMLQALTQHSMARAFEQVVLFMKEGRDNRGKLCLVPADVPPRVVNYYLSGRGEWALPTLRGIISAPIMHPDTGAILTKPGYHDETELYLASDYQWLEVADEPTLDDARTAIKTLCEPFEEFPFVTEADGAVHIAAILTAIERRLLGACPIFAYTAPVQRTGKSKLAEAVGLIATGTPPAASSFSSEREEFRKTILAGLREGHPVIHFDNIEHPVKSPDLAKAVTQSIYSDRVLGQSKILHLPTTVTWLINGNNLEFRGDLSVRALLCRINANDERPEERIFKIQHLEGYIIEHRAELVRAALTILRAFHAAGSPEQNLPLWGGFDMWSRVIREALVWCGMADPCETRKAVRAEDTERESGIEVLAQLHAVFPPAVTGKAREFTVKEAIAKADEVIRNFQIHKFLALREALLTVGGEDGSISVNKLGRWMRSWRGRVANGMTLERANQEGTHPAKWTVSSQAK